MIGLGSNRLTVCRRGGMSVTQAGKGGMEWLAGDGLRGRSPYSAQATAALKAQFPTQWPTIRDYGFAHPALVPFINEDPMLVCSLMELGKIRWIQGDGTAWIDTEYVPQANFGIRLDFRLNELNNARCGILGGSTSGNGNGYEVYPWNARLLIMCGGSDNYIDYLSIGVRYVWEQITNSYELTGDGTTIKTGTLTKNTATTKSIGLFTLHRSSAVVMSKAEIFDLKFYDNGTEVRHYVPFIRDGEAGVLDLVTGSWKGNSASSGTLTISESPS